MEVYLAAVGHQALRLYADDEGEEWQDLDEKGWGHIRNERLGERSAHALLERGLTLPAYRELARVLEPWLYFAPPLRSPSWDARRWERRFLD